MKAIFLTALIAVCSSAKLDRTYLPPASAKTAGGSSDILQTPVTKNQGLGGLPAGSFENDYQGIVVDAAVGTRVLVPGQSGLGAPRISYGSTDSKVGEAAFRDKHLQGGVSFLPQGFLTDQFNGPETVQANRDRISNTVRLETNNHPEGYNYIYETDNGISAQENGITVNGVKAQGGYSYTGDDGQVYTVTYTADEDGYQPKGSHLPTPPPIPAAILESLEQNAKDEAAGLVDDGSYDAKKYNTGGDYSDSSDNDKFNDRQSNKFANRPGSNTQTSGSFINQNNQALRTNTNAQSGFISSFNKDANQPGQFNVQSSEIPSSSVGLKPQNSPEIYNNLGQTQDFFGNKPSDLNLQSNYYLSNKFGQNKLEQRPFNKEYSPSIGQQNNLGQTFNGPVGENKPVITTKETSIPLSQQSLQNEGNRQNTLSLSRPSSYEISSVGQINTQIQQEQFNEKMSQPNKGSSVASQFAQMPINRPSISNLFASQQTVIPTNQPSRELTTPFETRPSINLNNDRKSTSPISTFSTSEVNSNPQIFAQKPSFQGIRQQITSTNLPINTYEGDIYQYNKPASSLSTSDAQLFTQQSIVEGPMEKLNLNNKSTAVGQINTSDPSNTYKGEIYQYNKPMNAGPIIASPQNINQKPTIPGFMNNQNFDINQQTSEQQGTSINQPTNSNDGQIYQYNKSSSLPNSIVQKPSNILGNNPPQSAFMQIPNDATSQAQYYNQFNQAPTTVESFNAPGPSSQTPQGFQGSILQTRPTDASVFPNIPSDNQYTQSPGFFNTQAFFSQQSMLENKRPSQNFFLQTRPTMPSFSQTNINQYKQPQGSDGSYYYDKPSTQFQQQFPSITFNQNKITQLPQFVDETQTSFTLGNTELNKPITQSIAPTAPSAYQFQNTNKGITQASASSFGSIPTSTQQKTSPIQPLSPNSQSSQSVSSQPGLSSFAQAFVSTQYFTTAKPQGQTAIVGQSSSVITDSEIYQYNKPAESLPTTQRETNEEKNETESTNGLLKPQSIDGLDKQGSFVEMMNFRPANTESLSQGMNLIQNFNITQQGQQTLESSVPSKPDQNIAVSEQPSSRPLGSTILGSPCCKGSLEFNKSESNRKQFNVQSTNKPEQSSPKPIGEQFDVNRKPPTFDSTGYHY